MLDLKFPKMVIANTVKFSCFYDDRSDCATCTTFPQQIGSVEDNPTLSQMLGAHVSYQYSTGIVFVCIISFMFNLNF